MHSGHVPTTGLCIAVLFLRVIEFEADPATRTLAGPPPEDLIEVTGEVLEPFALAARLPRRECASARRLIAVQRRFTQVASKRFRPAAFMNSEEFPEALDLFRLRSMAWGQGWDVYEAWVQRFRALQTGSPQTEGPTPDLEVLPPRKRRRRRRGRRGPGPEGAEPAETSDDIGTVRASRAPRVRARLARMRKIHVLSDERPSKPSSPRITASQVSCTTSSAMDGVLTNWSATLTIAL